MAALYNRLFSGHLFDRDSEAPPVERGELSYAVEDYLPALPEMRSMYAEHYAEVAVLQDKLKLDPDYERYEALDRAGNLHLVTVRHNGELVGYYLAVVSMHLHYKTILCSSDDIFFLRKDFRRGFAGAHLFTFVERTLKARGVKIFVNKAKRHVFSGGAAGGVGRLLEALGSTEFERSYIKWIGDDQ